MPVPYGMTDKRREILLSQINQRLNQLLETFPDAVDVREGGACECQWRGRLFFFGFPGDGERVRPPIVFGRFYCPVCQFYHAGYVSVDEYEDAQVVRW